MNGRQTRGEPWVAALRGAAGGLSVGSQAAEPLAGRALDEKGDEVLDTRIPTLGKAVPHRLLDEIVGGARRGLGLQDPRHPLDFALEIVWWPRNVRHRASSLLGKTGILPPPRLLLQPGGSRARQYSRHAQLGDPARHPAVARAPRARRPAELDIEGGESGGADGRPAMLDLLAGHGYTYALQDESDHAGDVSAQRHPAAPQNVMIYAACVRRRWVRRPGRRSDAGPRPGRSRPRPRPCGRPRSGTPRSRSW